MGITYLHVNRKNIVFRNSWIVLETKRKQCYSALRIIKFIMDVKYYGIKERK